MVLTTFSLSLSEKLYKKKEDLKKTWQEAHDFCKSIGGDLMSVHSMQDLSNAPYVSQSLCRVYVNILMMLINF